MSLFASLLLALSATAADVRSTDYPTISAAIAACAEKGGGRVVVPKGRWSSGAIRFRSNCELHLEKGAEIVFSQDPADYLPAVHTSWEGMECWNYCPLVYAYCCTNVAITGAGTLRAFEGRWEDTVWQSWVPQDKGIGAARRRLYDWGATDHPVDQRQIWKMKDAHTRPHFVQFNRCRDVRIEGVRVRESPFWTIHLYLCDGVVVRDLDVVARNHNNDGIDIEMTRNVLVERCSFDQGDDTFVFKSGRNRDAWRLRTPTENVEIRDCHMKRARSFITVGSEISGGVRNVWVHDCSVGTAGKLVQIKTNRRRGGFVEGIRISDVRGGKVDELFCIATDVLYEWASFPDYELRTTRIGGISLENVRCDETMTRVNVQGDAGLPIAGLRLRNVRAGSAIVPDLFVNATDVVEDGRPVAALRDFPISEFGAKPDGTDSAAAIARAVAAAERTGGGRVVVPAGTWKTGPVELKRGVGLHLVSSSKLLFSDNPADYARADGGYRPLLSAEDAASIRMSGGFGILEALVEGWRSVPAANRPPLARFSRCAGLCFGTVAFHNAPGKVVEMADCEKAVFNSVEFIANVPERDFISVAAGPRPVVRSCSFRIGDGTWDVLDPRHRLVHPEALIEGH